MKNLKIEEMTKEELLESLTGTLTGIIEDFERQKTEFLEYLLEKRVSYALESYFDQIVKGEAGALFAADILKYLNDSTADAKKFEWLARYVGRQKDYALSGMKLQSSTSQISNLIENTQMMRKLEFFHQDNFGTPVGEVIRQHLERLAALTAE